MATAIPRESLMLILLCLCDLHHNGALDPLLEQLAAVLINAVYRACGMVCVCRAAARAIKLCPAVLTFRARICVAKTELVLNLFVCNTVPYVSKEIFGIAYELMARIEIAPRGNCHIFSTRAAARDALIDAGAVL